MASFISRASIARMSRDRERCSLESPSMGALSESSAMQSSNALCVVGFDFPLLQ